jgi:hypothetical protein
MRERFVPQNLESFDPVTQEYNRASPATIHMQRTPQDCKHTTTSKAKQRTNNESQQHGVLTPDQWWQGQPRPPRRAEAATQRLTRGADGRRPTPSRTEIVKRSSRAWGLKTAQSKPAAAFPSAETGPWVPGLSS